MTAAGNGKALVIGNGVNGDSGKLEYTRDMGFSDKSVFVRKSNLKEKTAFSYQ